MKRITNAELRKNLSRIKRTLLRASKEIDHLADALEDRADSWPDHRYDKASKDQYKAEYLFGLANDIEKETRAQCFY